MVLEEKRALVKNYCESGNCGNCKLCRLNTWEHEMDAASNYFEPCLDIENATEEELDKALELINGKVPCTGSPTPQEPTVDMVNHPSHYCREDGMESIDEMVLIFGKEAVKTFCLLNVWKYRYRAADKDGERDLKKSDWYMRKYKELCELGDTNG